MSDTQTDPIEADIVEIEAQTALSAIEKANIDCQIETAKKWPRKLSAVKQDMLSLATLDEETAASCFYTLPRGGKTIQGPSVRMAEIAASCWGNLRVGSRTVSTTPTGDNPHVVVQSYAHDLQTNTAIAIEKRRRITKKKSKDAVDEDDINLAVNSCASIALRDAVFKIVPRAIINPIYEQAKKVAVGDVKSLAANRQRVVDRLKQMGATEERIFAVVGAKKIDDIQQDQLEVLIGLGTALKDGATTLEEAFPVVIKPASFVGQPAKSDQDTRAQAWQELSLACSALNMDFAKFKAGAVSTNSWPDAKDWKQFSDVPDATATKILASQASLERWAK